MARAKRRCPVTGKIRHASLSAGKVARAQIRELPDEKDREGKLNVYQCDSCRGWHVGHWKPFGIGEIPKEVVARVAVLAKRLEEIARMNNEVNAEYREIVAGLDAAGHPVAEISRLVGMKQRAIESWLAQSGRRGATARMDTVDEIAEWYHRGQVDKAGRPYIEHPRAVAEIVVRRSGSKAQRMAALLHDVLEDTEATMEELRTRCVPEEVLVLVDALTHRRGESYEDYIRRVASVPGAALVKRADILHNTDPGRLAALDEKTRARLIKKYSMAVDILDTVTKELS